MQTNKYDETNIPEVTITLMKENADDGVFNMIKRNIEFTTKEGKLYCSDTEAVFNQDMFFDDCLDIYADSVGGCWEPCGKNTIVLNFW